MLQFSSNSVYASSESNHKYAVVVNSKNEQSIDRDDIIRIFLGRTRTFPKTENRVYPMIQKMHSEVSVHFITVILKKRIHQYEGHWSRLLYTGKAIPPLIGKSDKDVLNWVAKNQGHIGIVNLNKVDESVRVIYTF